MKEKLTTPIYLCEALHIPYISRLATSRICSLYPKTIITLTVNTAEAIFFSLPSYFFFSLFFSKTLLYVIDKETYVGLSSYFFLILFFSLFFLIHSL
jgi:hypothetical protein